MSNFAKKFKTMWRAEVARRKKAGTFPEEINHQVSKELERLKWTNRIEEELNV